MAASATLAASTIPLLLPAAVVGKTRLRQPLPPPAAGVTKRSQQLPAGRLPRRHPFCYSMMAKEEKLLNGLVDGFLDWKLSSTSILQKSSNSPRMRK